MILVSFACNDEHGNFTRKVAAITIHGDDVDIEIESPTFPDGTTVFSPEPLRKGGAYRCDQSLRVRRKLYDCYGYKEWFGNWCWDAAKMPSVEVRRLILDLRERGWHCVHAEEMFYEAFKAGVEITPMMLTFALSDEPSPEVTP